MPVRSGEAVWQGNSRQGQGTVKVESGAFQSPYSWSARFEQAAGTNPEELIAAAHAGCYSMALASDLTRAGFPPKNIHTTARVHIERVGEGWKITLIELETEVDVPGIDEAVFLKQATATSKGCPVSVALASVEIVLRAKLVKA
jgi:lipoyl-dependent peroxiredoxin